MIKSFLNLCLILVLNALACLVAFIAAATVAWVAVCGARRIFAALQNAAKALRARQRRKEAYAHATR